MTVVVTGISCQTALGGLESTWRGLLLGRSGICQHQPFPELSPQIMALIGPVPQTLETLVHTLIPAVLRDANLDLWQPDCAIVLGSSRGKQPLWEGFMRDDFLNYPNPVLNHWETSLPHRAATLAAQLIGSTTEVHAPMNACATGITAIAQGFRLIESGYCDRVLVGAIEAPITPLTLAGFRRMGALSSTHARPFDRHRDGFVLGEGGAVMILERESTAQARHAKFYGYVLGIGLTADAYHFSTPEPTGKEAARSIDLCLRQANLNPDQIQFIHAHGTATRLNDAREAQLFKTDFPNAAISSTKGATGHTLGASGAIGAVICLKAIQHQILPPCIGLQHPEYDTIDWVREARPCQVNHALCLSFGFGGQNGAVVFGRSG
jgi:3-oxoacyl-[acyl-carrier-protein] synthase II